MGKADESAYVYAPEVGKVYKHAVTTTHVVYATPTEWLGQKVCIAAEDCKVHIAFGTSSSIEVGATAVSTRDTTTKVLTVNTLTGGYIPKDQMRDFDVDRDRTFFAVEGDASGYWIGQVSGKF